ncbi:MAG TPA: hypothetical protein VEY94_00475 [Patescibacteria group bacterium]|nr:hypothetical protein [Patescibacteria group bacterium]
MASERLSGEGTIPTEERTTSFGLWRFARDYLEAARILANADRRGQFPSQVSYQCACQGLELAFKAYLRASGKTVDDLRALGHSLVKCMHAAMAAGLRSPSAEHVAAIQKIDNYYREHEFRYIVTGSKSYPNLVDLLAAGAGLLVDIASPVAEQFGHPEHVHRMKREASTLASRGALKASQVSPTT